MTVIMWDFAFLTRHVKGDSFENYDKVLDEAIERGYNTIRIDPMPHVIDLSAPEKMIGRGTHGTVVRRLPGPWGHGSSNSWKSFCIETCIIR